jgi:hypothetical protein
MTIPTLFQSPELTIEGTYNGNTNNPVVRIFSVDLLGHDVQENVTLTGLAATVFVDIFHPHSTVV